MQFTVGADPELFLVKDKRFVSAYGMFPGTKKDPMKVRYGAMQVDGCALEFNINPALTAEEFQTNVSKMCDFLQHFAKAKDPELSLAAIPTAIFDQDYFNALPVDAKTLGCDPDYNAYTGHENPRPDPGDEPFRTGAGHIHLGWVEGVDINREHVFDCQVMTKQLDAALYVPSLLWDSDTKRRTLYGQIGSFRPKPYGVEYRALSNAWVSDPDVQEWLFDATVHSARLLEQHQVLYEETIPKINIDLIREGEGITFEECLQYVDMLETSYDFPKFPSSHRGAFV